MGVRAHSLISGYNVFTSSDDLEYRFLAQSRFFAVAGVLTAPLGEEDDEAVLDTHPVDRLSVSSQTPAQADADTVLMFIGDEILSIEGYTVGASGEVTLTNLRRGRFGTAPTEHAMDELAFLIRRENLCSLEDPAFEPESTHYFKTTSYTIAKEQDIATAPAMEVDIPGWEEEQPE